MKTPYKNWTVVGLCVLAVSLAGSVAAYARADQGGAANTKDSCKQDKIYHGTVSWVDSNDNMLKVQGYLWTKKFALGNQCGYSFLDSKSDNIAGLHAGQRVAVSYRNIGGRRVAELIEQQPMVFKGTVNEIDPQKRTMSVRHMGLEKTFQIAANCPIDLNNDRSGSLADVQPGNHVTVRYETPYDTTVAWQITRNGQVFTGDLTAIDMQDRTAKAKDILERKNFKLAPNCVVVVNGKQERNLKDIRLGQRLKFDYVDANGVNTVNRIATIPASGSGMTASTGGQQETPAPMTPIGY